MADTEYYMYREIADSGLEPVDIMVQTNRGEEHCRVIGFDPEAEPRSVNKVDAAMVAADELMDDKEVEEGDVRCLVITFVDPGEL